MKFSVKTSLVLSALLLMCSAFAANSQQKPIMVASDQIITNLSQSLQAIQAQSNIPVIFPKQIPVSNSKQRYYFSTDSGNNNTQYILNVDSTSTCNGMKACNVGSIVARVGGEVGKQATGSNLTQTVQLANGQTAYYTPAHAGADYWPTTLQWKTGNVAYYLSWVMSQASWDQKQIIINLANSAINNK